MTTISATLCLLRHGRRYSFSVLFILIVNPLTNTINLRLTEQCYGGVMQQICCLRVVKHITFSMLIVQGFCKPVRTYIASLSTPTDLFLTRSLCSGF